MENDLKYSWAIDEMFNEESLKKSFEDSKKKLELFKGLKGKLNSDEDILNALKLKDEISSKIEDIYCYSKMKLDENTQSSSSQNRLQSTMMLLTEFNSSMSFFEPELISLGVDRLNKLKDDEKFKDYDFYLEELVRSMAHFLDDEGEKILANLTEVFAGSSEVYEMLHDADMSFEDVIDENGNPQKLTNGSYSIHITNPNQKVREDAYNKIYKSFQAHENTIASSYANSIKTDCALANIRKYESALHSALYPDNVDVSVYRNLVKIVRENVHLLQRFVKLKAKAHKLSEMHHYDIYLPFEHEFDKKIDFEDGFKMVCEALEPLGEEYLSVLRKSLDERWMDVYEKDSKRSGAYSFGTYTSKPFVLLNYKGRLNDVSTLAHELGHSMHSYFSRANQPYSKSSYTIFVAEVASTVNEALMIRKLIENAKSNREKIFLIGQFLEQFKGTLFRQVMFADFEAQMHDNYENGMPISAESANKLYEQLILDYFGDSIVKDDIIKREWMRIPHFYSAFYVYKYSTSYCAAIALSEKLYNKEEGALESYLKFLKLGGSMYPIDELKVAGVDMSTSEPIISALNYFEKLLDDAEKLI